MKENTNDRRVPLRLILLLSALLAGLAVMAQGEGVEITKVETSKVHPLFFDLNVYADAGSINCGKFWKPSSSSQSESVKNKDSRMWGAFYGVGTNATLSASNVFGLNASVGYKSIRYANDWGLFGRAGVHSHWISTSLSAQFFSIAGLGLESDIFIGSRTKQTGELSFEGINENCFNRVSLQYFVEFDFTISRLNFQARLWGNSIIPQLNPTKLAYNNMERVWMMKGEIFSLRVSYQLFTTKKVYAVAGD